MEEMLINGKLDKVSFRRYNFFILLNSINKMKEIIWIILWSSFWILNINGTDSFLNFTTGIDLGYEVK